MKTRLIQIGNSRGVRIPKAIIAQAGLSDEVELEVRDGEIVIASAAPTRQGWAAAARAMAERGNEGLLDPPTRTRFEDEEWAW